MSQSKKNQTTAWVDVMRTGTFSPQGKTPYSVTIDFLDNCIKLFNSGERRIPLVFGHPQTSSPAYGWVSNLRRVGEVLQAQFSQVHNDAKTLVENGYYKNVSVRVAKNGGLEHVGLLGAVQPAIPGLREVEFAEDEDSVVLEFAARTSQEAEMSFALNELAEYKERERRSYIQSIENRINGLCKNGQLMPYEREQVLEFALSVAEEGRTIQFSSSADEIPMVDAFLNIMDKREPSMLLANFSGGRNGRPVSLTWTGSGRPPSELERFNNANSNNKQEQEQVKDLAYLV